MTRRCSQCSANGHNTRTCPARGGAAPGPPCVKLFGVRIAEGAPMKRSASVGCLSHCSSSSVSSPSNREDPAPPRELEGYVSDETHHASCSSSCRTDRKKGTPWTEDEHRMFLVGLQKLGKGDWRGISRNYVISRTPTQVASHAQKYFIRQTNAARRKRRSSLFDMVTNMPGENTTSSDEQTRLPSPNNSLNKENTLPIIDLNLQQESIDMETVEEAPTTDTGVSGLYNSYISETPPLCPPGASVPLPFWPAIATTTTVSSPPIIQPELCDAHEVIKPTPILRKVPVHLDELANMSKLCLGEASGDCMESSSLSVELRGIASSPRRSAFHSSSAVPQPSMSPNEVNVIHAV